VKAIFLVRHDDLRIILHDSRLQLLVSHAIQQLTTWTGVV
jgi:hypothetical protein